MIVTAVENSHSFLQIVLIAKGTIANNKKITVTPANTETLLGAFNSRNAPSSTPYAATHTASVAIRRQ
jgi:hypothetical protein